MQRLLVFVLILCLTFVGCSKKDTPAETSSQDFEITSGASEPEVIITPEAVEPNLKVSLGNIQETTEDPRMPYSRYLQWIMEQVETDPAELGCSTEMLAKIEANPGAIAEINTIRPYYIYSIAAVAGSEEYFVRVSCIKDGAEFGEVFAFTNKEGVITVQNIDALLTFLSGDAYA